jgi:hypothetical protein
MMIRTREKDLSNSSIHEPDTHSILPSPRFPGMNLRMCSNKEIGLHSPAQVQTEDLKYTHKGCKCAVDIKELKGSL